jgi:orotate phosphoribosyltransferase
MSHAGRASTGFLAKALFEMGAIWFGSFTLPDGRKSSYDVDLRLVPSHPEVYTKVLAAYLELVEGVGTHNCDAIVGVATAGVTVSSPLAVMTKKPMMYVRKKGESHSPGKPVEGIAKRGSRVILVDNIVSSGGSLVYSVAAPRKDGYKVDDAAVLLDRLEGGGSKLERVGVRLHSYTTTEDLLEALRDSKPATRSRVDAILKRIGPSTAHRK